MTEPVPPPPGPDGEGTAPDSSVMRRLERITGEPPRVHLRDAAEEATPVVRMHPGDEPEAFTDDPRFQALGEIARGGVGVIFKGRDRDLGRDLALKVLRRDHLDNEDAIRRFIEEAQIGGQLLHPGVVPVYGLGLQPDGRPFFAMRLVKGRTLAAHLEDRRAPTEDRRRLLAVFEQVCQTMAYAHARGVIHRDLKPANIMLGAFGEVQVMDWGFSKVLGREGRDPTPEMRLEDAIATIRTSGGGSDSLAGSVMGTPSYMPPEQALGKVDEIDERCDVFALGALLCEILTGRAAYDAQGKEALIMAAQGRLEEAHARLDRCDADPELVRLARRCLSPEKAERPRDAGAVARTMGDHLAAAEERARENELRAAQARAREQQETARAAWERRLRQRGLAIAGTVVVAVLGGIAAWLWTEHLDRAQAAEIAPRVHEALQQAAALQAAEDWDGAVAAAEAAWQLADTGGADATLKARTRQRRDELRALADEARARRERQRREAGVLHRLREAAACHGPGTPVAAIDDAYARAFAGYGIDVAADDPAQAAERIGAGAIADELVAALDDWAWLRRTHPALERRDWRLPLAIARRADDDAWRGLLRDAVEPAAPAVVGDLARRAAARGPRDRARAGWALLCVGGTDAAFDLLRTGQAAYPDSFWLALRLAGAAAARLPPDREVEARSWTVALALEPDCVGIRQQLAEAKLWLDDARARLDGLPGWPGFDPEARARLARAGGAR